MFRGLTLHGGAASLLWGFRTAVVLRTWAISKSDKGEWHLSGTVERVDAFQARQRPLRFTAPRAGGFWCWPVKTVDIVGLQLRATLGLPEQ